MRRGNQTNGAYEHIRVRLLDFHRERNLVAGTNRDFLRLYVPARANIDEIDAACLELAGQSYRLLDAPLEPFAVCVLLRRVWRPVCRGEADEERDVVG